MSNTANILSRLSLAPAGSFVVYASPESHDWCFTVHLDELHEAHVADIAVGAHPYSAITLSHDLNADDSFTRSFAALQSDHLPADRDGIAIVDVLADWMDWCDDVMESASQRMDSIDDVPSHEAIVSSMRHTWRLAWADQHQCDEVNAAA